MYIAILLWFLLFSLAFSDAESRRYDYGYYYDDFATTTLYAKAEDHVAFLRKNRRFEVFWTWSEELTNKTKGIVSVSFIVR